MIRISVYNEMDATLLTLKSHLQYYRKLDDDLKEANIKTHDLRRERKVIENEMSTILSKPEFQQYDKLEIKEDGSIIKIQRPGMWTKSWSMSKNELMEGLDMYFSNMDEANAIDCYDFLVDRQKLKMAANEFNFERSSKKIKS